MLHSILAAVISAAVAVLAPMILLEPVQPPDEDHRLLLIESVKEETETVRLKTKEGIITLPLEDYLEGVLICEMPLSFEEEALKAQCVAARTFALRQIASGKHRDCDLCSGSGCCQAWQEPSVLLQRMGTGGEVYLSRVGQIVEATAGQVIRYQGTLIDAVYFSCSGGKTEPAAAVWGSDVPYLVSVESPGEEGASKYRTSVSFTADEFRQLLNRPDLTGDPIWWFGEETRTEGGGVEELVIGGEAYEGTELRRLLGLNSTLFIVEADADQILFRVQGYGHRVGMSQYGANAMAKSGSTYQEILSYYYPGTTVG